MRTATGRSGSQAETMNFSETKDEVAAILMVAPNSFYFATVNTPAMTMKLIGKGSQYAWAHLTPTVILDGSKTYKLNLPKDPPAENSSRSCSTILRPVRNYKRVSRSPATTARNIRSRLSTTRTVRLIFIWPGGTGRRGK